MPIQDVIAELNHVQSAGLIESYAIGGAVAAGAYIEVSSTVDVDVFVVFAPGSAHPLAPLGPVWAYLTARGAREEGGHLVIGGWPVQLLPPGTPLYDDAILNARTREFGQHEGRIMGPEHLAAIALATGRSKDIVRVEEFIKRNKIDMSVFLLLVERFGLQSQWKTFQTRFLTPNA